MKKILIILVALISFAGAGMGQDKDPKNAEAGRLQAYKIAFLTKRLNLTPDEAQRFWPIYNQYEQELRQARIENRQKNGDVIEVEEKILNIRKKYNGEFGKAINPDKINLLFRSEKEFGNIVQKELMERRQQNPNNRRRN